MTGENIEVQAKEEIAPFSIRYFVQTDSDGYVTGMMVAVSEQEAEGYVSAQLQEVSEDVFKSIGQDSKFVDGKVVQGEPKPVVLTVENAKAIKSALLAEANTNTQPWQTQLLLGIISEEDKISLINWMMYYKKVQEIDASVAPNISWPDKP
ncbi:tail fiber assembly protein [Pantoea dispersa]|uniref:tail fiber assembly protein n=1 Tax=Pantoea TaxID=53335 RepID=UPI001CCE9BCF|nr:MULTISPECIES: tail fiber assembly protein [Pantoea]MCT6589167.1 tail fiber assembly protein [Pantoea dispersa]UBN55321.1 tail fiber assembly protein [Pantoea agglomerans]HDG5313197.1 tail fiber assembly protein [Klebsiella pneumoniae]